MGHSFTEFMGGVVKTILSHTFYNFSNKPSSTENLKKRDELAKGAGGESTIATAQATLVMAGYDLGKSGKGGNGVDGDQGTKTTKAIMAFQAAAGLKPTGKLDTQTTVALNMIAAAGLKKGQIDALGRASGNIGLVKVNMPLPADQSRSKEFTPYLDASIADEFNAFAADCKNAGIPLVVSEGFRTRAYQEYLFDTDPDAAVPGSSPHESGLAFDLDWNPLTEKQRTRLLQIAENHGFYQTVMPREPWHFGIKADWNVYQCKRDYNSQDWLRIERELK